MKKTANWLWGFVLIALGVFLGINALGIAHINIFFPGWWTLFIIVPCAIGLFTDEHKGGATFGLVLGICLFLSCLDILPFGMIWKLMIPAALIIIGLSVLVHGTANGEVADKIRRARAEQKTERRNHRVIEEAEMVDAETESEDGDDEDDDDEVEREEYWSTFGDQDVNYKGKIFRGCRVDAVFGGADIDLRQAEIMDKAILKASSIFGGIIIYVPDDVKVEVASTSIFGGVSDKRKDIGRKKKSKDDEGSKEKQTKNAGRTLYIDANCVFGGVEIR